MQPAQDRQHGQQPRIVMWENSAVLFFEIAGVCVGAGAQPWSAGAEPAAVAGGG